MTAALILLAGLLVVLVPAWLARRAERRDWVPAWISPGAVGIPTTVYRNGSVVWNGIVWHDVLTSDPHTVNVNTWKDPTP